MKYSGFPVCTYTGPNFHPAKNLGAKILHASDKCPNSGSYVELVSGSYFYAISEFWIVHYTCAGYGDIFLITYLLRHRINYTHGAVITLYFIG